MVRLLLEKGADVAVANNNGWTPLKSAANEGHLDVAQLLLEKGANINGQDFGSCTVICKTSVLFGASGLFKKWVGHFWVRKCTFSGFCIKININ